MNRKGEPQLRYATAEQVRAAGRLALLTHGKAMEMLAPLDGPEDIPSTAENDRQLQGRSDWAAERRR